MSVRPVMTFFAALAASGLAGCAGGSPPARVSASAGSSWAAVLPGPEVATALAAGGSPDWISSRRDASLSLDPVQPVLATNQWPEPKRPSLDRPRFVRVIRSPEGFIYYRTEERYEYRRGWY